MEYKSSPDNTVQSVDDDSTTWYIRNKKEKTTTTCIAKAYTVLSLSAVVHYIRVHFDLHFRRNHEHNNGE